MGLTVEKGLWSQPANWKCKDAQYVLGDMFALGDPTAWVIHRIFWMEIHNTLAFTMP